MQDVLEFILKNITTVPADIKIDVEEVEGTTNYIVTVNPADVGRIIGKEGKVIKAIRTIMRVIAIQRGVHVRISVVSENDAQPAGSQEVETPATETPSPVTEDDGSITVEV
jgi:hypothetical protein